MPWIIFGVSKTLKNIFWGKTILFHLLFILLTYTLIASGFDWWFYKATRSANLRLIAFPAVALGGLVPLVLPLAILVIGEIKKLKSTIITAWAIGQAAILGLLISSFYKAFTGRIPPAFVDGVTDISSRFQFGFLRGGVFWGWPSSHTTVAFAMAITLWVLFPKSYFKYLALIWAFYVGIGVSLTIHWFSEFVAGAILGSIIGLAVAKTFLIKVKVR